MGEIRSIKEPLQAAALTVHRDVKPANVLLAGTESGNRVYLTDYGLVPCSGDAVRRLSVLAARWDRQRRRCLRRHDCCPGAHGQRLPGARRAFFEALVAGSTGLGFLVGGVVATAASPRAVYLLASLGILVAATATALPRHGLPEVAVSAGPA